jgi:soluble lytic murein transglycosylase-like protein
MDRFALALSALLLCVGTASAEEVDCDWESTARLARLLGFRCQTDVGRGAAVVPPGDILRLVKRIVSPNTIDPRLVLAVIAAESAFDTRAISPRNAIGLMQLMPETVARYEVSNPFDAEENIRAGAAYLGLLRQRFGNLNLALAAYNAGEANVLIYGDVPPFEETIQYVARVTRFYERYRRIY